MAFPEGAKVVAFPSGEKRIGFVVDGPHGDDEKYNVQVGDSIYSMGYREVPGDAAGKTGGSFRKVNKGA